MIKQIMFTSHLIRYPLYISFASWSLLVVLGEMAAPFQKNENTAVITISSDPVDTEKENLSTQIQAEEKQPTLKRNTSTPTMFFRRRIVLLTLSLILAIVIIVVTILGLVISSHSELAEAEARKAKFNLETDIEHVLTSSINNDVPRINDSDEIDVRDSSSFLPIAATTPVPISGSGSGHSTAESENSGFIIHFEEHSDEHGFLMPQIEIKETEIPAEVGSGDAFSSGERQDNGSGSGGSDVSMWLFL